MAPSTKAKTGTKEKKGKKEKVFHPESRKAGQLARTQLRKTKLAEQAVKRHKKHASKGRFYLSSLYPGMTDQWARVVDMFGFFYHSLPEEGVLTLDELHSLVRDLWLTRHDAELEEERAARRKGRPKSVKEQKLEEIKQTEAEDYRTGMGASSTKVLPSHFTDESAFGMDCRGPGFDEPR